MLQRTQALAQPSSPSDANVDKDRDKFDRPIVQSLYSMSDVLEPLAGRDLRHNTKPQKTKSPMADKTVTDILDYVYPNAHSSSQRASFFACEDNDAVIKIIMKRQKTVHETCLPNSPCELGLRAQRAEQSNHVRQTLASLHRQPLVRTLGLRQIMELKSRQDQGVPSVRAPPITGRAESAASWSQRVSAVLRSRRLRSESGRGRIRTTMVVFGDGFSTLGALDTVTSDTREFRCCFF